MTDGGAGGLPRDPRRLFVREIYLRGAPGGESEPDGYPYNLPVARHLGRLALTSPVVFFAGENGAGKSTLLEALAVALGFNAEGGSRSFTFSTAATHSGLHTRLGVAKGALPPSDGYFLRAESFYNVATEIERMDSAPSFDPPVIGGYGGVSLHAQSHGESFFALVKHRFRGGGLYILDEPEAALSPTRQLSMLRLLYDLARAGAQFIISSHSPLLMAFPGAQIFVIEENGIAETPYEQVEHVRVARSFLGNPGAVLGELLRDDED